MAGRSSTAKPRNAWAGDGAATCHRYLVSPFGIVTWSLSRRLAAALLAGRGKKSKQPQLPSGIWRLISIRVSPVVTDRFNSHLISPTKAFCFSGDIEGKRHRARFKPASRKQRWKVEKRHFDSLCHREQKTPQGSVRSGCKEGNRGRTSQHVTSLNTGDQHSPRV